LLLGAWLDDHRDPVGGVLDRHRIAHTAARTTFLTPLFDYRLGFFASGVFLMDRSRPNRLPPARRVRPRLRH
jgi:hypothetical protein